MSDGWHLNKKNLLIQMTETQKQKHEKKCKLKEANIPHSSVIITNRSNKYLNYREQFYPTTIHFPEKTFP